MPTIDVSKKDLEKMVGKKLPKDLDELFMFVKAEIDGQEGDELKLDVKETNRPDLWSTEGIARELKAKLGMEKKHPKFAMKKGKVEVFIDKNLENVRPFIACAVVRDVKVTENLLKQMIQLQEKVGMTFGRKRKETGIGLYDFDIMKAPIYYKGFKDNEIEFIPLEWKVPMKPSEILTDHDKGKEYAHLLAGVKYYPIVIDSNDVVASMPPIINSQKTGKVTENTKNLFIEVTGFKWEMVNIALKVIVMALADRGGKIEQVKINFPKGKTYPGNYAWTPFFGEKEIEIDFEFLRKRSGLELKNKEITDLLEKARYRIDKKGNKTIAVYPDFRNDILHQVDVLEDMLIAYGYNSIEPMEIEMSVTGSERKESKEEERTRSALVGLGLQEIIQYTLTSKEKQIEKYGIEEKGFVELGNPVSMTYAIFRKSIVPEMLEFFAKNKDASLPQKVFEVGKILELDESKENKTNERTVACVAITHSETNFTQIKSYFESYAKSKGIEYKLKPVKHPAFIEGRAALIEAGEKTGIIGEIHPKILENFGLDNPVIVFELDI